MIKIKILAIILMIAVACYAQQILTPDVINIYKLPQFKSYLVGVTCNRVKTIQGVSKTIISDKAEIKELVDLLEDSSNFKLYTDTADLDTRILIEYVTKGKVVKQICWSRTELIQMEGRIYSYDQKIEDYLLKKHLIIKLNK
jgi:uncharacterized protein YuzE